MIKYCQEKATKRGECNRSNWYVKHGWMKMLVIDNGILYNIMWYELNIFGYIIIRIVW